MKRILVIEDDPDIGHILTINLRDEGFSVEVAADGRLGLSLLKTKKYDLLLLDLMLPGINGLEICREVRHLPHYQPIIIISAKSAETQKVIGLELGADDYVAKPFSLPELIARIRAIFRRVDATARELQSKSGAVSCRGLNIDPIAHTAFKDGKNLNLTVKEFDLLLFFAQNPGKAFTRSMLLDRVWGYNHAGYEHTVNSHISRLRGKIEKTPEQPEFIQTVWGVGYKFLEVTEYAS